MEIKFSIYGKRYPKPFVEINIGNKYLLKRRNINVSWKKNGQANAN